LTAPYARVADVHAHNWSQFSQVNADGINTRLQSILDELVRAAKAVKDAGGSVLRVAGDLFHVRGSIAPSVFNPTIAIFKHMCAEMGVDVEIIPGNHDLEGKYADELGNAMQQLDLIDGCVVLTKPEVTDDAVMLPWIEDLDDLRAVMAKYADPTKDLIIHAPLNGVIKGLPDHGLDPEELALLGYRRVFSGHYHNHKEFAGGVYSIGATTHQTWSDPGTAAGFLLVYPDRVEHHETAAPRFVNIDYDNEITRGAVEGAFIRLRFKDVEPDELKAKIEQIKGYGALGVVDHSTKKREVTRGVSSTANVTLEVSVANYVAKHLETGNLSKKRIAVEALDVLREARTVGSE
jgi:DNA repair exonuclease SbcCD nuclease subunit